MRTALFLVVLVGLLFAFVYPTRTFLDQRESTSKARAQLELLQAENARMDRQAKKLSTDSEIEQLAREKYGLVRPGERPFVILPTPTTTTVAPGRTTTQPAP
jgi:cell division protein FtsB